MEIEWITFEAVLAIHNRQIAEHGGSDGLRDSGLLLSALARPQNLQAYTDDADMEALAASYAFGIAKNHPFVDGNKRTALVVMRTFLVLS
jgi:death on curing protein